MTQGRRRPPYKCRRHRLSLGLRRSWRRLVSLDKDVRLIAAIALIVVAALAACLMTIREVERNLLRTTATGAAVHWTEFLQSRLRGLHEILAAGLVTAEDHRLFDFPGAAGRVPAHKVFSPPAL